MLKPITFALLCNLLCFTSNAEGSWIEGRLSPKLTKLLNDYPAALKVLTNAFAESFTNRAVGVFYYYSNNKDEPRASHFYPATYGSPEVCICVEENQHPLDEFITLLYETLNARGEARFKKLTEEARAGTVSKDEFVRGVLKIEFEATSTTRDILASLSFKQKEIRGAYYHKLFKGCPQDFKGFLAYTKDVSAGRGWDAFQFYGKEYDALHKQQ
jgi:hypothetical protein